MLTVKTTTTDDWITPTASLLQNSLSLFEWYWCQSIYVKEEISTVPNIIFRQKKTKKDQKKISSD